MSRIKLKDAEAIIDLAAVLRLRLAFISDRAFSTLLTSLALLASPQMPESKRRIVYGRKSLPSHPREVTATE